MTGGKDRGEERRARGRDSTESRRGTDTEAKTKREWGRQSGVRQNERS